MEDFDAPSFSLGIDEDEFPASRPQTEPTPDFIRTPESNPRSPVCQDGDFEDLQCCENEPFTPLKRLRRGPPPASEHRQAPRPGLEPDKTPVDCDDIEDFSSEDDEETPGPRKPSVRSSSSSKPSLYGRGFLSTPSHSLKKSAPSIARTEGPSNHGGGSDIMSAWVQKMDPLRKLRLLTDDSDDDEEECCAGVVKGRVTRDGGATKVRENPSATSASGSRKIVEGVGGFQKKLSPPDVRKYFSVIQSQSLPSPAFDEFCDEYFSAPKDNLRNDAVGNGEIGSLIDTSVPLACQYFDSDDIRVQRLLRQRLPYFLPVNAVIRGDDQSSERVYIDYLGQFGSYGCTDAVGNQSRRGVNFPSQLGHSTTKKKPTASSAGKGKKGHQVGTDTSNWRISGNRNIESVPRDAGKRRVCAQGRNTGYWFTDQTGKKVYVTKDGQEMTSRAAYMQYKKESGTRFRKTNKKFKKRAAKKK